MSGEHVLIVDDNPTNLKLARLVLATEGYVVSTASSAEEALEALKDSDPRLILMDLQLPGMDGLQLTRTLKAHPGTRDIIVVAMTAYAMKGDELMAARAGCDGYLSKPIDTRTLAAVVAGHLM
jgi:two-component system cell cycle response regulator DivK